MRQWFNNLSLVRGSVAHEDEEDEDSSPDMPSFEDLVEEIDKQEAEQDGRTGAGDESDVAPTDAEPEESKPATEPNDWKWGNAESEDVDTGTPSSGTSVDALWGGSETDRSSESDDQFDASKVEALVDLVDDAPNVLLAGPADIPLEHEICSHLSDIDPDGTRRRLLITTEQTADERLESLRPYTIEPFDETTIIVVGDQVRSNGSSEPSTQQVGDETVVLEALHDPKDLTRLGVLINKYLGTDGTPPVICFHTLNGILQFVELEKLFRFLHILQSRVRSVGANAHYLIDPKTVDEQSVSTLQPLFDFTIRYDEDGSISVDPRT